MTIKKLNRCQTCWAKFLLEFNFIISYIPGKKNQKADFLTYYLNHLSLNDNNTWQQYLL